MRVPLRSFTAPLTALIVGLGACLACGVTHAADPVAAHGLTAPDLVSLARVSGPALSPDSSRLVWTQRETDLTANKGRTDLWSLDLGKAGAAPLRLTRNDASDSDAAFAPDGRSVYFLSTRSGSSQVWRLSFDGGEAAQVTMLPLDVGTFRLSPQGDRLALTLDIPRTCLADSAPVDCAVIAKDKRALGSALTYDSLLVRHWDTWADGTRSVLFSQPLDEQGTANGKP